MTDNCFLAVSGASTTECPFEIIDGDDLGFMLGDVRLPAEIKTIVDNVPPAERVDGGKKFWWIKHKVNPHLTVVSGVNLTLVTGRTEEERRLNAQAWIRQQLGEFEIEVTGVGAFDSTPTWPGDPYKCIHLKVKLPEDVEKKRGDTVEKIDVRTRWGFNPHVTITYVNAEYGVHVMHELQKVREQILAKEGRMMLRITNLRLEVKNL